MEIKRHNNSSAIISQMLMLLIYAQAANIGLSIYIHYRLAWIESLLIEDESSNTHTTSWLCDLDPVGVRGVVYSLESVDSARESKFGTVPESWVGAVSWPGKND